VGRVATALLRSTSYKDQLGIYLYGIGPYTVQGTGRWGRMAEVSREVLAHFQCQMPSCKGWWTIGDPHARLVQEHEELSTRTWWCPWCGNHQVVTPKPPR
jgi:hypothetical protein